MDIAKIRKKAREKEEKDKSAGGGTPAEVAPETRGEPVSKEGPVRKPQEETDEEVSLCQPGAGEKREEVLPPSPVGEGAEGPPESKEVAEAEDAALELLTFSLSSEEFAFRVSEVEEIIRFQRITGVPTMPEYVRGITSLRGKIIPVIDLKNRLALKGSVEPRQEKGEREDRRILILSGPKGMIGATIDKVLGVMRFPAGNILDPPAHLTENELKFIEGVVILEKRFISIIRSDDALDIELT
jgi:purine-binding chemotaxis protein CheW